MPEIISSGHNGPSGLGYNSSVHILGVTNYNSNSISIIPLAPTTTGTRKHRISSDFHLFQNYPNPFNPNTVFSWHLNISATVKLRIYNLVGQTVAVLINKKQAAGFHSYEFNASGLTSGIYFYTLETNGYFHTRKMVLLK